MVKLYIVYVVTIRRDNQTGKAMVSVNSESVLVHLDPSSAEIFLYKPRRSKVFQLEIVLNVLVSSL